MKTVNTFSKMHQVDSSFEDMLFRKHTVVLARKKVNMLLILVQNFIEYIIMIK